MRRPYIMCPYADPVVSGPYPLQWWPAPCLCTLCTCVWSRPAVPGSAGLRPSPGPRRAHTQQTPDDEHDRRGPDKARERAAQSHCSASVPGSQHGGQLSLPRVQLSLPRVQLSLPRVQFSLHRYISLPLRNFRYRYRYRKYSSYLFTSRGSWSHVLMGEWLSHDF